MESKRSCPECHLIFEAELPVTGVLVCPLCNTVFPAAPPISPVPLVASPLPSAASGQQVLRGFLAVGAVLFLVGGIGYAYHLMNGVSHKAIAMPIPAENTPAPAVSPPQVEFVPTILIEPTPPATAEEPRPSPQPPQLQSRPPAPPPRRQPLPLLKETSPPLTLPERVNRAIDRGLAFLRKKHYKSIEYRNYLGLLGLTLLECGVAGDDPSVQQIAAQIRSRARDLAQTYELALAILFLDRLGNSSDRVLIRIFGERLLLGQLACGAWSYSCLVNGRRPARTNIRNPSGRGVTYHGDNSNTQFAILGLWVAQRHGVRAGPALLAAEQYFRNTQAGDGSWGYHANMANNPDSMTCAGLMSLAMRYGVSAGQGRDIRPDHPVSVHDAAIHRGLNYLARSLDKITVLGHRVIGVEARDPLYFLWSLERVAAIYDLKKLGEREWYPWAAQMLVETQLPDGRWQGLGDPVGTCLALLVLKRSNFAQDLQLAVQEPGSRPMPEISLPIIREGPDVFLGQTNKPRPPAPPIGPSIAVTPQTK
jgi:hypothetical protein